MATQEQRETCFYLEILFRGTQSLKVHVAWRKRYPLYGDRDAIISPPPLFPPNLEMDCGGELKNTDYTSCCILTDKTSFTSLCRTHDAIRLEKEKGTHNTQRSGCASVPDDQSCTLLPNRGTRGIKKSPTSVSCCKPVEDGLPRARFRHASQNGMQTR
jgi:hypothetical protein